MLLIYFLLLIPLLAAPTPSFNFEVVTFNIRQDASHRYDDEKTWEGRRDGVIEIMKQQGDSPTLFGLQEVLHNQLMDIKSGLGSDWEYYGVGREDGKEAGEYLPIFYNKNSWKLEHSKTKWLSETPDVPSKSWGAAYARIVTITQFKHEATGIKINYLNTHYDHISEEARGHSSDLIAQFADGLSHDFETFISGDFNSVSSDKAYKTMANYYKDSRSQVGGKANKLSTYTGFEPGDSQSVIDFIWVPQDSDIPNGKTQVTNYKVLNNVVNGVTVSDHRPVTTKMKVTDSGLSIWSWWPWK